MPDSTHESDRIIGGARQTLVHQRAGGMRSSIGEGSARLKRRHRMSRMKRILIALAAIVIGAIGFGLFVNALGIEGLFVTMLLAVFAVLVLARYPRMETPRRETLARGSLQQTVARTELWLEQQRPALPAPAVTLVDQIGVQLDGLNAQLQGLDENTPAAVTVRNLVSRDLPDIVGTYTAIPRHLRTEPRAGSTPDAQLHSGLTSISREIDTVTRKLAEGALDDLAVRTRYLDYKYGDNGLSSPAAPDTALPPVAPAPKALGTTDPSSKDH